MKNNLFLRYLPPAVVLTSIFTATAPYAQVKTLIGEPGQLIDDKYTYRPVPQRTPVVPTYTPQAPAYYPPASTHAIEPAAGPATNSQAKPPVVQVPARRADNPDGTVLFYGQVNRSLLTVNDGANTDITFVDNTMSSTRFGLKAEYKDLPMGLKVSAWLENGFSSNPGNGATQNGVVGQSSTPASNNPAMSSRQANISVIGDYGALTIGRLSTASTDALTHDLTGVEDLMDAEWRNLGGGFVFRRPDGSLTSISVNSLTDPMNTNRTNAIRYDTPLVNGWQGRFATIHGGNLDASLSYKTEWNDFKFDSGLGAIVINDGANNVANRVSTRVGGSLSVLHNSGVGLSLAASEADLANKTANAKKPFNVYAKVGYTLGDWEFAVDHNQASHYQNPTAANNNLTAWGVGIQHTLIPGVTLATLYRQISLEDSTTPTQDLQFGAFNLRIKF